jgi:acetyltransferase-like isoleucine patch superfamily enzyme
MKHHRLINLAMLPFNFVYARLYPVRYARWINVKLGEGVVIYGSSYAMFGSEPFLVTLGDNVHITHAVFLTHDGGVLPFRKDHPTLDVTRPINVGANCFIGYGAMILPGVTIGEGCVVGAGAVVTKDAPAGSVVAGNPARVVSTTGEYLQKSLLRSTGLGHYEGFKKRAEYKKYFGIDQ